MGKSKGEFEVNSEVSGKIPEDKIVTAVCTDNSQTLFVKSSKDGRNWELPTGRIEPGETPKEAMRRELKEETNASVSNISRVEKMEIKTPNKTIEQYIFKVDISNKSNLRPGTENCEVKFLDSPPGPVSFGETGKQITSQILSN